MLSRRGVAAILVIIPGALAFGACSLTVSTDGLRSGGADAAILRSDGALDDARGTAADAGADADSDGDGTGDADADARSFPPGATIWPVNGHGYAIYVVPNGLPWTEARTRAEQAGGHLATIGTFDENDFVLGLVDARPDSFAQRIGPWLGGYQPSPVAADEPAGGWAWVDGTPFTYSGWTPAQPDNTAGVENFMDVYRPNPGSALGWNDDSVTGTGGPIISYLVEFE